MSFEFDKIILYKVSCQSRFRLKIHKSNTLASKFPVKYFLICLETFTCSGVINGNFVQVPPAVKIDKFQKNCKRKEKEKREKEKEKN